MAEEVIVRCSSAKLFKVEEKRSFDRTKTLARQILLMDGMIRDGGSTCLYKFRVVKGIQEIMSVYALIKGKYIRVFGKGGSLGVSDVKNFSMGKVKGSISAIAFFRQSVALGRRLGGHTHRFPDVSKMHSIAKCK